MGRTYWWTQGMWIPTPGFVKWSLVRPKNFRKEQHRGQRYVIVMTDAAMLDLMH